MALLFMDGFDWLSATGDITQQWRNAGSNATYDATGSNYGGKCVLITNATSNTTSMSGLWQELYQAPSGSVIRMFFRIKTSGWTGNTPTVGNDFPTAGEAILKLQSLYESTSGAPCLSLGIGNTGQLVVMRGENATSNARTCCAIGTVNISDGSWHRVEVEITIGATGSVKTWVDGTADINSTSLDTDDFTASRGLDHCTTLGLGLGINNASTGQTTRFDDVVIWDDSGTDFTGGFTGADLRIQTLLPSAAGDSTQFTPSAGSNFQAVDDPLSAAPDGDTTYVESSTSGHIDLYNYQNYSVYPSSVYAVKAVTRARITTNGRAQIRAKCKVATTTANGATKEVWTSAYSYTHQPFGKQPNGSGWDLASLNALQMGFERL